MPSADRITFREVYGQLYGFLIILKGRGFTLRRSWLNILVAECKLQSQHRQGKAARPNEHNRAVAGEIQRSAKLSLLPRATTHKAVKFTLDHSPHHPLSYGGTARFPIGSLISYTSFTSVDLCMR